MHYFRGVRRSDIFLLESHLSHLTLLMMGSSRFWLKVADEESKSISHEIPISHWLKATAQSAIERHLWVTMVEFQFTIVNSVCSRSNNRSIHSQHPHNLSLLCRLRLIASDNYYQWYCFLDILKDCKGVFIIC